MPRICPCALYPIPSTHAPTDHCCFDGLACFRALPSTAPPSTRERNDVSADVTLAKELERLIRRWNAFVKGIDSCLAGHHAILLSVPKRSAPSAAMASRNAYMMPRAFGINLRGYPWHSSQIMEEIELSERGPRAPRSKRNSGGKMRRPRCAKPRTPNPNHRRPGAIPSRMKSKADAFKQA